MTNSKITYVQALTIAIADATNTEVAEKLTALKVSIEKKNSRDHKPTARQTENENIKSAILDSMEVGHYYTITEMIKTFPELSELSNQKVSSLMRQLVETHEVVKTQEKRVSYFSLAE